MSHVSYGVPDHLPFVKGQMIKMSRTRPKVAGDRIVRFMPGGLDRPEMACHTIENMTVESCLMSRCGGAATLAAGGCFYGRVLPGHHRRSCHRQPLRPAGAGHRLDANAPTERRTQGVQDDDSHRLTGSARPSVTASGER